METCSTALSFRSIRAAVAVVVMMTGGVADSCAEESGSPVESSVPDGQWQSLSLAINDLTATFTDRYPKGPEYLQRLQALRQSHDELCALDRPADQMTRESLERLAEQFDQLRYEALLANPLLDFDRLLLVKRGEKNLGLPKNWQGNSSLPATGYDNEIATLSRLAPEGQLTTLFRPDGGRFVGDVDLDFDADRLLFSMPNNDGRWQVFQLDADGTRLLELPLIGQPDVDNHDACYLPNGNIIFASTAPFVGVPCVKGADHVANLFLLNAANGKIRQLTFEQDHNWCPTVLDNGRILYLRWEYSGVPHFVSRILFQMNPDGTEQTAYYGSNSYWPNAMFFARPVPNHPTRFLAVVGGHHDVPRMGELVLFDVSQGRHEADGVVQRIPGFGKKVEPIILDGLASGSWPKFLHPWPLSDKYFLVSAKPTAQSKWGIYLVDVFDNMLLLKEVEGYALLEPIPLRERPKPPQISDRVSQLGEDATIYMANVYSGAALEGVPRGTVKRLRIFSYHFAYHNMGGQINRVGLDGPWDVKRIIGTAPVEADGSAYFRAPSNTPLSLQPLDAEGKAIQLMRSWLTAMPGENLSCVGCHDRQNTTPPNHDTLALAKPPAHITPWYGPTRGFSFEREVQVVLDKHCTGCHDGQARSTGEPMLDFRSKPAVHLQAASDVYNAGAKFTPSYLALRSFVRSPTIESDMHALPPGEFHADTTRLVQLLRKGHYGIELDQEAWDRLITWIDLNAPAHGTWHEIVGDELVAHQRDRRREMMKLYAGRDEDPEAIFHPASSSVEQVIPEPTSKPFTEEVSCPNWPFDAAEAHRRQSVAGEYQRTIELGDGIQLHLQLIPAGEFVMGDPAGHPDEQPATRVQIDRPFWIGRFEVTNEQYRLFDATHDSRLEHGDFLQFSERERGYALNSPRQPVVRVSWQRAMDFCRWLSRATGEGFSLPTEAQWEYACRAGAEAPLSYGSVDDDFSTFANLADATLRKVDLFDWDLPVGAIPPWRPADDRFNDNYRVSAPVGSYQPNAWGLYDMHGNVAEWTRSCSAPYAYSDTDGRNDTASTGRRVVRGGSWYDRPRHSRSAYRIGYWPYQRVYDVGLRVVCEVDSGRPSASPDRHTEVGLPK